MPSPPDPGQPIYHMCALAEWRAAEAEGDYRGSSQDAADGFIHFSTQGQVRASAAKHRAGQAGLVLLTADAGALGDALKWEPATRGGDGRSPDRDEKTTGGDGRSPDRDEKTKAGALFPHLYGPLPLAAVTAVQDLPLGPDGRHLFPPGFPETPPETPPENPPETSEGGGA
ncbi:MAG: DUF952 domain-containing protein [Rhodospirillales bacterium]